MLESALIKNYQIIKKIEFKFSPGINVLTGPSDHGKSASLRALHWNLFGRPTGDGFRTTGTKETKVTTGFKEGEIVHRKTKSINEYIIGKNKFKALRSDVPEEVYQISKMAEENFQKQTGFFLLEDSPGAVSRKLNKVSDLEISDNVLSLTNSKIRALNSDLSYNEERTETVQDTLSSLEWVGKADKKLRKIEKKEVWINENSLLVTELNSLLETASSCESVLSSLNVIQAKRDAEYLFSQESSVRKDTQLCDDLNRLLTEAKNIQKNIKEVPVFNFSYGDIEKLDDEYIELNNLLVDHEELTKKLKVAEKKVKQARIKFKAVLKEAKICPLCESEL